MHNDVKVDSTDGREMCAEKAGTIYVNAAVVPRIRPSTNTRGAGDASSQVRREHNFTLIDLVLEGAGDSNAGPEARDLRTLAVSQVRQVWVDSASFTIADEHITYDAAMGGVKRVVNPATKAAPARL
jgi:hypothetical protein